MHAVLTTWLSRTVLQVAMGPPTTLFPILLTLLCECFHSISELTANSQATSDTSLHPLNHLTAIFFKTSTFFLLPIHHPPSRGIYVSYVYPFSLTFIYPCAFMWAWRWWLLPQLLPTFPSERLLPLLTVLQPAAQAEFNIPTITLFLPRSPQAPVSYPARLLIDLN